MGFHNLTICADVDLTAFGSVQRPVRMIRHPSTIQFHGGE